MRTRRESRIELLRERATNALHFAIKHEQRVWGSGDEHEQARKEVERLNLLVDDFN